MNKEYEIYYEAFDIKDADERKSFILEQCDGDKTLFDNIMRLFPDKEEANDDTYGKYQIEKQLGKGGMGVVYLASYTETFDSETFTKQVALKTINPELKLEPKSIKIFLKEIKTLAELEHPNIARFLDIGTSEKGKPFFVMEYVDGVSLIEHCNKNKFSIKERIEFFRQVLDAISYSHKKGFLHCDLKPNNIIVDSKGTPKVIDFGIASKYGSFIVGKNQTTFFQNAFTPNYASPEQIKGEKNLTEATDVYSLGVVLYELLTGQLPIDLNNSESYPKMILTLERNVPPTLRKSITKTMSETEKERLLLERDCQSISELKNNLNNSLDEIVQKALSQKPNKRFATVSEFDAELEDYLSEESFFKQIKSAFAILYRKKVRQFRRLSLKWLIGFGLLTIILLGALSQSQTFRTLPYFLQLKFSSNHTQISLSNSQQQNVENSIPKLKEFILKDFIEAVSDLENSQPTVKNNIWSLADYVTALSGANHPLDPNKLNAIFDQNATEDGCWKEEQFSCKMIISGWVLLAKKELGKPISDKQLEFILKNQSAEGWFPAYPNPNNSQNAATYPTAVILLGLNEHLQQNLINANYKERVQTAMIKGVTWILQTRRKKVEDYFWSDCPNAGKEYQTPSVGVDGTIIFTLHRIEKSGLPIPNLADELKEIDSNWLDNLSQIPDYPLEHKIDGRCITITEESGIMDRSVRFSVPWLIAATVEAFPNGTTWQKATAQKRLESLPISEEYKGFSWGAGEYLITLSHLRKSRKS